MLTGGPLIRRLYKVVTIKDASNEGVSLTDRDEQYTDAKSGRHQCEPTHERCAEITKATGL